MEGDRARSKLSVFLALIAAYYVFYYVDFAREVAGYLGDVLRHFEFVRRFLGRP